MSEKHTCISDGITCDGDFWDCLSGALFGLCEYPRCGGVCEYKGPCECDCHKETR